jgi:hypothetical protein
LPRRRTGSASLRRSKTDREGEGARLRGCRLRPVEAVQTWLPAAGLVFRPVLKGRRVQAVPEPHLDLASEAEPTRRTLIGVLNTMTWLLALATTCAALRSAWYWYKSSQIYAVPDWVEVGREEPKDPLQVQLGWMNALMKAGGESAILNRWGAIWTAGTVVLGAATTLVNVWSS